MQSGWEGSAGAAEDVPAEQAMRLREARKRAGFESARQFCQEFGVSLWAYYGHESGARSMNTDVARRYAALLRTDAGTILYGTSLLPDASVSIVGIIGRGGKIRFMQTELKAKPPVPEAHLVGLKVEGNELAPAYRDGDVVYFRPLDSNELDLRFVDGQECVVRTAGGDTMLRQVTIQSNGLATLIAYAAPILMDIEIVAASPVEVVRRALQRNWLGR